MPASQRPSARTVRARLRPALAALLLCAGGVAAGAAQAAGGDALAVAGPPHTDTEPPRVRSLLEHAWAAESGIGQRRSLSLAASLYCDAARLGSAEGHYRAGVIYARGGEAEVARALTFLTTAGQFGHDQAFTALERLQERGGAITPETPECLTGDPFEMSPLLVDLGDSEGDALAKGEDPPPAEPAEPVFDLRAYLASFRPEKARIAGLLAEHAPEFGIEPRLAIAIASVESNFDPMATSPRNAQGVMQLIPDTAKRFNVKNPYDALESIRGGLSYLRWLTQYFAGDIVRVIAAYNAGEGAVDRYRGLPPYEETRMYVRRVLDLAGLSKLHPEAKPKAPPATAATATTTVTAR